jgi:hypothetical protein
MAQCKEEVWVKQDRKIRSLSCSKQDRACVYCYKVMQGHTGMCRYVLILFIQSSWSVRVLGHRHKLIVNMDSSASDRYYAVYSPFSQSPLLSLGHIVSLCVEPLSKSPEVRSLRSVMQQDNCTPH